jgi:hypothetical protein
MNRFASAIDRKGDIAYPVPIVGHSMFDGLSRREIIGWIACLALAVGLTLFGSAYLVASSFMSADVSDVLKPDSAKLSQQHTP